MDGWREAFTISPSFFLKSMGIKNANMPPYHVAATRFLIDCDRIVFLILLSSRCVLVNKEPSESSIIVLFFKTIMLENTVLYRLTSLYTDSTRSSALKTQTEPN